MNPYNVAAFHSRVSGVHCATSERYASAHAKSVHANVAFHNVGTVAHVSCVSHSKPVTPPIN